MHQNIINQAVVTIPKDHLGSLPHESYRGEIRLVDSPENVESAVNELRKSDIIGFDTETRPSFKKGQTYTVSLLQLATPDVCFLFRLNRIGLTDPVVELLQDPTKLKIGLSIHDDFHNLRKLCPTLEPDGFVDLQQYVKKFRIADNSLSRIYGILFGLRISKGQRLTNWEAENLTPAQQSYASLDAKACIKIYRFLEAGAFNPLLSPYLTFPEDPEITTGCPAN